MKKKAVILVSGGVDSSTVLAMVSQMDYEIYALSFNYLQRHHIELEKIKKLIKNYKVSQHKIINIDLRSFGGSALTDDTIAVPKYKDVKELADDIPVTYVPARNTIFLSYALGFAEIIKGYDIFIGVHATDYANYPDCRPEFIKSFEVMANFATAIGVQKSQIKIHAPLIDMTKTQIVEAGLKLGVDYNNTISCYEPTSDGLSCRECHACLIRLQAFAENNMIDPIKYI
ncbi:7-cyano-7-deazaguanine synthase [Candidatus Trichorickettsia mobilis]|uniref:7-cyano-7-deazaguanine synthase n=1 Tax=Candidatus Trichorickettsia mobilis TaxID=1346319 RepID=A0ABZ0UUQ7_9RICK|nr:7-cyano-7-deazaguanine synthase QueC [Candidatus Trichorickettsia mobilis]WPY00367.1 7-cyano-7-deazaguanine synthase [Candidatus Trichorickettsia mobilis]